MGRRRRKWASAAKRDTPIRLSNFRVEQGVVSGYSNPSCYAAVLQDCAHDLSQEHFMSFALLMGLVDDPRGLHVSGSYWGEAGAWIQPERIASPILCTRHNEQLQPLDGFAADFERECHRIYTAAREHQVVSTIKRYHGNNLERWMLKALCGLVASGNARTPDGGILTTHVPETWVKILYGNEDLAAPCGLYLDGQIGSQVNVDERFSVAPITTEGGRLAGLSLELRSFAAILIAQPFAGTPAGALQRTSIRHPRFISWSNGNRAWRVDFSWADAFGPGLHMAYSFVDSVRAT